jgi:hypothetical protein
VIRRIEAAAAELPPDEKVFTEAQKGIKKAQVLIDRIHKRQLYKVSSPIGCHHPMQLYK